MCVCQSHIPPVTLRVLQSPLYTKNLVVQWFPQYLEHWNLPICVILCFQSGMLIAPVLANLGPLEALKFRPNPSEVCSCQLRLSVEMVNLKKTKTKSTKECSITHQWKTEPTTHSVFQVEEIFTLTLAHVCNPENRGYTHFRTGERYGYTLPVFRNGKHRVWGLTAVALDHTLKLIVPP